MSPFCAAESNLASASTSSVDGRSCSVARNPRASEVMRVSKFSGVFCTSRGTSGCDILRRRGGEVLGGAGLACAVPPLPESCADLGGGDEGSGAVGGEERGTSIAPVRDGDMGAEAAGGAAPTAELRGDMPASERRAEAGDATAAPAPPLLRGLSGRGTCGRVA